MDYFRIIQLLIGYGVIACCMALFFGKIIFDSTVPYVRFYRRIKGDERYISTVPVIDGASMFIASIASNMTDIAGIFQSKYLIQFGLLIIIVSNIHFGCATFLLWIVRQITDRGKENIPIE